MVNIYKIYFLGRVILNLKLNYDGRLSNLFPNGSNIALGYYEIWKENEMVNVLTISK